MRRFLGVAAVALVACSKPNASLCCVDEADCAAHGIANGSTCDNGLLCRGNQCIAETCSTASECEQGAPYCSAEGLCAEQCTSDPECPGYQQSSDERFCSNGICVACRDNNDCASAALICDAGSCRTCATNSECASAACGNDGTCVDPSMIAYVNVTGSAVSDCTESDPCNTITRALTLPRAYIVAAPGTYSAGTELTISENRSIIGRGPGRPILTRSSAGPIVSVTTVAYFVLDNVEVSGATSAAGDGHGIYCTGASPSVRVTDSRIGNNVDDGIRGQQCMIEVSNSEFVSNGGYAIDVTDANTTVDRCNVHENGGGISIDGGTAVVTNNFIVRNTRPSGSGFHGLALSAPSGGHRIEFNTIVDNSTLQTAGSGFECAISAGTGSFPNNIMVRNLVNSTGNASCTFPGSIILDDASTLHFVSPDNPPYDYHLMPGSAAIDQGTVSTIKVDFDDEPRPAGVANDVGADEVQ
jgi:hypothetical protein